MNPWSKSFSKLHLKNLPLLDEKFAILYPGQYFSCLWPSVVLSVIEADRKLTS